MKTEVMLKKAAEESERFGLYAKYFLECEPDINMPTLRDCFKHNASVHEYRLHKARIEREAKSISKGE